MEKVVNEDIILIGTAHVSKKSVAEVKTAIEKYKPEIVAVELCGKRYQAITKKDKWENMDVAQVLKTGKGFLLLVQMFLAMIQRKLGEEFGVEPGAEMLAAIDEERKYKLKIALVDRDITITFRRAWRLMSFREKMRIFWYSMKALIGYDRIELEEELEQELERKSKKEGEEGKVKETDEKKDDEIDKKTSREAMLEQLMKEDMISAMMEELRTVVPNATKALIDERDQYISKKIHGYVTGTEQKFIKFDGKSGKKSKTIRKMRLLRKIKTAKSSVPPKKLQKHKIEEKPEKGLKVAKKIKSGDHKTPASKTTHRVLAVVGAGHLKGIKKWLTKPEKLPELSTLSEVPKKRISIMKGIGYLIPILFVSLFIYLLYFGKWDVLLQVLLAWFLINGICSAIGAAIAFAHPLSIITAFFAAPLTSLNPAIGAGWVAGYVELKLRTPTVKDIRSLSTVLTMKDFFKNKVIKVLMVMALANLGSVVGTFLAGWYIGKVVLL